MLYGALDPDAFLHILAADQMLRDGVGPLIDQQSFASVQTPWTPYAWLSALAMKLIWEVGGYRAAVATHAMMAAGVVTLIALACREIGSLTGSPRFGSATSATDAPPRLTTAVATAAGAFLALPHLGFRPSTLATLFLASGILLILRDRRLGERSRSIWLLIPLSVLLINIHPIALMIPMCVITLLGGALWERRWIAQPPDWIEAGRRVRRYEWLLVGTFLGCLATPMLPGLIKSIIQLQFKDPMVAGRVVAPFQPFYGGPAGAVAAVVVGIMALCLLASFKRLRAGEMLWTATCTAVLFRMGGLSPVFAVGVTPLFAAALPRMSDRVIGRPTVCGIVAIVLLIGAWRIGSGFPARTTPLEAWANRDRAATTGYPFEAADYVEQFIPPATGRIINEYAWGGFLQWRLQGRFQSLLDERTNLYTREFWQATYLGDEAARIAFFEKLDADAAVLPVKDSTFRHALTQTGWRSIYRDERAEILLPPIDTGTATAPQPEDWRGWATLLLEE